MKFGFAVCVITPVFALLTMAQARAQDCGTVTYIGQCNGSIVSYCDPDNSTLVVFDCNTTTQNPGSSCGLRDCTDSTAGCEGYYCVSRLNQQCGSDYWWDWCDVGSAQGCINGVCAQSQACNKNSYTPSCTGNIAAYCNTGVYSVVGTVWMVDCAQLSDWQTQYETTPCREGVCVTSVPRDAGPVVDTVVSVDTRVDSSVDVAVRIDSSAHDMHSVDRNSPDQTTDSFSGSDSQTQSDAGMTEQADASTKGNFSSEGGCGKSKVEVTTLTLAMVSWGGLWRRRAQRGTRD